MKIAICRSFQGKPDALDSDTHTLMTKNYTNVDCSQEELLASIRQGYAFCAQHKNSRRKSSNFTTAGFLAVDIDSNLTIEHALEDLFFSQYGGFLYTTTNHCDQFPRFRLVFELEHPITQASTMKTALSGLIAKFGGDKTCNDACRQFYGSIDCDYMLLGNTLNKAGLGRLLILGEQQSRGKYKNGAEIRATIRSGYQLGEDSLVLSADGEEYVLADLPPKTPIHCPVHVDNRPSAFTLRSKSGVPGVHCMVCDATYFTDGDAPPYDFNYSLSNLNSIFEQSDTELIANGMAWSDIAIGARINEPYLPFNEIKQHLVLIKSPKGTGKTEWLKYIVNQCRAKKQSVLLIGHRQSLIRSVAKRLELLCYLNDNGKNRYNQPSGYYAICVDSLPTLLDTKNHRYDVVLVDEVEQVFAHLTARTLKARRNRAFLYFKHYIDVAKQVYALDADLSHLTFNTIYNFYDDKNKDPFFLVNDFHAESPEIDLYENKNHLLTTLLNSLLNGERCFVCTNSKNEVKRLVKSIQEGISGQFKVMEISSDNSQTPDIQAFITNITKRILDYDALIVSPSVGTGVDITFPDNQSLIDNVFGFFETGINTHFDIDQQIGRVRHPKKIRVWVSPRTFNFETEPEVIMREMKQTAAESDRLIGILPDGTHKYADDTGYLQVYADVTSQHRASLNNLRQHFIAMKKHYGWVVHEIERDAKFSKGGKIVRNAAIESIEAERTINIISALIITSEEYNVLNFFRDSSALTEQQNWAMRRYEIESFYRRIVDEKLVGFDNDGRKRQQIKEYEILIAEPDRLSQFDLSDIEQSYHIADRRTLLKRQQLMKQLLTSTGIADDEGNIRSGSAIKGNNLADFIRFCMRHREQLARWYGIDVRRDIVKKPAQQLGIVLRHFGIPWDKAGTLLEDGKKVYRYEVPELELDELHSIIRHRKCDEANNQWCSEREEMSELRLFNPDEDLTTQIKEQIRHYPAPEPA